MFKILDFSRRNSLEAGDLSRESVFVVLKERRLVPKTLVYEGMLRFSFLLETCQPGSVPDHHLIGAILDLVSNLNYTKMKQCIVYNLKNKIFIFSLMLQLWLVLPCSWSVLTLCINVTEGTGPLG